MAGLTPKGVVSRWESVLFIGTEFSILYTSVYLTAGAAYPCAWCLWSRVSMHSGVHRFLSLLMRLDSRTSERAGTAQ